MPLIKSSFKNKTKEPKAPAKKLGTEKAAVVKNEVKVYTPTGQWRVERPEVSASCIACQTCVKTCPEAVIEIGLKDGKKRAVVDYTYCKGCGVCAAICPVKAIKMGK